MRNIVMIIILMLLLPVSVIARNSFRSVNNLIVVDSNGVKVGNAISITGVQDATVALEINGNKYAIRVDKTSIYGAIQITIYTTSNCTGQAYIDKTDADNTITIPNAVAPIDILTNSNNETLFEADTTNMQNINYNSIWNAEDKVCNTNSGNTDVYPVDPIFNLSDKFEPPYSLE